MATPRGPALPPAPCDPAVGTHTAVLLSAPPPPPTAYPLGHLMLGSSLRNQGRYLWNCSTDGRAEPAVGLTQVFKQARESTKRVGGSRQQHPPRPGRRCPAPPCAPFPLGSPCTPTAVTSMVTVERYVFASTDGRSAPLIYGNCWYLQAGWEAKFRAEKQPPRGLPTPPTSAAAEAGSCTNLNSHSTHMALEHQSAQWVWAQLSRARRVRLPGNPAGHLHI